MNTIYKDAALTRESLIKIDTTHRFRLKYMILGEGRRGFLQAASTARLLTAAMAKNFRCQTGAVAVVVFQDTEEPFSWR